MYINNTVEDSSKWWGRCVRCLARTSTARLVQLDSLVGVVGGDVTVYHGNKPAAAVNRTSRCEDR